MTRLATRTSSIRYAVKLLFQFRVEIYGVSNKRRMCEERIINFRARSAKDAVKKAKRRGAKAEHSYMNSDNNPVFFEFVGAVDLLELGLECDDDEVWYEIRERVQPIERRDQFVKSDEELLESMQRD